MPRGHVPAQSGRHAQTFSAITQPDEAGKLLRDMAGYSGRPVTRGALSLSAPLLLRLGELRAMEWAVLATLVTSA